MDYQGIIKLVVSILGFIITVFTIYQVVYIVIGLFCYKKFPKTEKRYKYGILIAARNEEAVIKNLLESIYAQDYPQGLLKIFVVADNCTDKTADIVRSQIAMGHGNTYLYEHNNPKERTKGFALKYLLEQLDQDGLKENLDGYFIFDADNILNPDYITKMNDAFDFYDAKAAITSFRNSKNFSKNAISACYGVWFYRGCRTEMRGRTVCNCSTRVSGTGYLATAEMLSKGWPYVTLTEDWEFSADQVLNGRKIMYCEDAVFFDEQPTNAKIMWRQRVRWARGHILVCLTKFKPLFKNLFSKKDKNGNKVHRMSTYDIMCRITPVQLINFGLSICQYIALSFLPLFGVSFKTLIISWLSLTGVNLLKNYIGKMLVGIFILIIEHKHLKQVGGLSATKLIVLCLFWPVFDWLTLPVMVVALFSKNLQWKPIPHKDSISIQDITSASVAASKDNDDFQPTSGQTAVALKEGFKKSISQDNDENQNAS